MPPSLFLSSFLGLPDICYILNVELLNSASNAMSSGLGTPAVCEMTGTRPESTARVDKKFPCYPSIIENQMEQKMENDMEIREEHSPP